MKLLPDELLPELLTEVLARLPVKTLLQFRCVCKSWLSIIDNPNFISMHLALSKNNRERVHAVKLGEDLILKSFRIDIKSDNYKSEEMQIVSFPESESPCCEINGYVNGLMLMISPQGDIMLWNPSIRKSFMLPVCPYDENDDLPVCDSTLLGFDPLSNDYKVVIFDYESQAVIYDLSKGFWRIKRIECVPGVKLCGKRVYSKGAAHWVDEKLNHVISFNCSSETLSYRVLPPRQVGDCGEGMKRRFLFNLGESVALYDQVRDYGYQCRIWIMGETIGGHVWTEWYSGKVTRELFCDSYHNIYVKKGGVSVSFIQTSKTVGSLSGYYTGMEYFGVKFMDTYVESLVLSNGLECQTLEESLDALVTSQEGLFPLIL